jgi:UDP-N-acetylmuramoyl-tripeptide--D-alanyl-D-alanine ligase
MLGSYNAIRAAKLEILDGLSVAVVNGDDDFLMRGAEGIKEFKGQIIAFAINSPAPVMAKNVRMTKKGSVFILEISNSGSATVNLNVHGLFNVYNALAAAAVSYTLGMSIGEIKAALETYRAIPMRFEVTRKDGITIINDSYNANPASMRESVNELIGLSGSGRSVAVLGDMRELGEFSEEEHRALGKMIYERGVDIFIAVGARMRLAAEECMKGINRKSVYSFTDVHDARQHIMSILDEGDTVLIKGSRSMSMEYLMEEIADAV